MPNDYEPGGGIIGGVAGLFVAMTVFRKFGISDNEPLPIYFLSLAILGVFIYLGSRSARAIHRLIWGAFNPTANLLLKISERKKIAERKEIFQKAEMVVRILGSGDKFSDDLLDIQHVDAAPYRVVISQAYRGSWSKVFEAHLVRGEGSTSGGAYLHAVSGGDFKIEYRNRSEGTSDKVEVDAYVAGDWERHLGTITREAASVELEKKKDREREEAKRLAEKAKNFGL